MSYTFLSAAYGNVEGSAIVAVTVEVGAVALSLADTPDAWEALLDSEVAIAAYAEPEAPVPAAISDRQFAQQLAVLTKISEAEAEAWAARGELPATMLAAVAALPEGDRFAARMLLSSATTYERGHPLVSSLGAILEYDAAELDDLWRAAALL